MIGDEEYVTCGSAIKLSHFQSREYVLNSVGMNLGSGSGQQIVTATTESSDTDTFWWIRSPNDPDHRGSSSSACTEGTAQTIPCGSIVRLTHLNSKKNLHSHNVRSPLSKQQEVSAFGDGDLFGDNGDDWKVVCSTEFWMREEVVHLQHVDSGKYLGASSTVKFTHQNCGRNCPILNHLEVFGRGAKDAYGQWFVEEGVVLSH